MIILSFDIGIKNLAYCMLDSEDGSILDWNLIDCSGVNETLRVIEELDQLEHLREADVILLEKQPSFFTRRLPRRHRLSKRCGGRRRPRPRWFGGWCGQLYGRWNGVGWVDGVWAHKRGGAF